MDYASGNAIVVIDADLQDPPQLIPDMIAKWKEGYDIVYCKRVKRLGETAFKKITAKTFYRVFKALTDISAPADSGDFSLLDKKVVDVLRTLPERNRYVRGLVSWVGFKQATVEYIRNKRFAGKTKYPLRKMLKFSADAITSFSNKPLKISMFLGVIISASGFLYLLYVLYLAIFTDKTVEGWASLMVLLLLFNGIVLIMLGTIGSYISRIYDETKARPLYIVEEKIGFNDNNS
jgi:dolichol-phosphate mannosyltransferase